jgi:putative pyruvate formate lyase activating enzyme
LPNIISALSIASVKGLDVPLVYNSNGYERTETLELLDGIIDIYLPDIKYSSEDMAVQLSNAPGYIKYNKAALKEMFRQVGNLRTDENNIAVSGILVRHLVLPNDRAGSQPSFKFLANQLSKDVQVSIMAQYNPCFKAKEDPNIDRKLTADEYRRAVRWAKEAGLHNILTQELDSSDIFVPDFKQSDPFK